MRRATARRKPNSASSSKPRKAGSATDRLIDAAMRAETADVAAPVVAERRQAKRVPYDAWVALLLASPAGDRGRPVVLRTKDISVNGIRVLSRNMIYPGSQGVMQLMRSDGRLALVGVTVKSSRYSGNMEHQTGLKFGPMPKGWSPEEFLDRRGRMQLLHPMLRENAERE